MRGMSSRIVVGAAVLAVLVGGGVPVASAVGDAAGLESSTALTWAPCADAALAGGGFECATMRVPKDRRKPAGPTFALALVRHPSTGTADQRIGSLVFNPGGPGGSGLSAISVNWELLPDAVRQRFDLVSWDPRGVNQSDPSLEEAGCGTPYPKRPLTGAVNWPAVSKRFVRDLGRVNRRCQQRVGSDLEHMGTLEAVEDLDRIRAAVGDERLTYWGLSYGTRIGYVYALRYPERIRAMVLDGSIDPASTLLSLTEGGVGPDQAYASFANVYPASDARWAALRRVLNKRTIRLADGQVLDRSVALDFVYGFVAQQRQYQLIADVIDAWYAAEFAEGEARAVGRQVGGQIVELLRTIPNSNAGGVFSVVNCLDYADRPTTSQVIAAVKQQKRLAPRYGAALSLMFGAGCSGLRVTPDPIPVITDSGSRVPVLILGSSRDGSTVVQWTARMSRAFPNSRTVTYAGGQHVTWGYAGSPCVDAIADEYVLNVVLPATDRACPNTAEVAQ
jgi:pimeloyl-ACP methyl ester carboxylesterase